MIIFLDCLAFISIVYSIVYMSGRATDVAYVERRHELWNDILRLSI